MATLEEWGEAGSKYRVQEETLQYFAEVRALGGQPLHTLSVPAARQEYLNWSLKLAGNPDWNGEVREFKVPAPAVSGKLDLNVNVYSCKTKGCARRRGDLIQDGW